VLNPYGFDYITKGITPDRYEQQVIPTVLAPGTKVQVMHYLFPQGWQE
jgi:hypothetical protein